MRYLKGTQEYGLWYKIGGNLDLKVITDVDWVGSIDDKEKLVEDHSFLAKD